MAAYDDLNVKRIFAVGIISIVVTAVTALAVQVLYFSMLQWQQAETAAESNYTRQNQILKEQTDEISTFGVNEENGNFIVPIDQVIDAMAKDAGDPAHENHSSADSATDET